MPYENHPKKTIKLKYVLFLSILIVTIFISSITKAQNKDTKVYALDSVKTIASYKGGMELMYAYLRDNLKYPKEAQTNNIQGKVFVSFIIEKDGRLTDVKAESGPGYGLNEEAVRVVKKSPAWTPAYLNNLPVRSKYSMPISFKLN